MNATRPYYRRIVRNHWSMEQWQEFGRRCQAVRREYDAIISGFPQTPGLTSADINAIIKADAKFHAAMTEAANLLADQHPDQAGIASSTIHGHDGVFHTPCQGRIPSDAESLTRVTWVAWGVRFKAIRQEVQDLLMEFQQTATKVRVRKFHDAQKAYGQSRMKIDAILHSQHRDWDEVSKVFYGPNPPAHVDWRAGHHKPA